MRDYDPIRQHALKHDTVRLKSDTVIELLEELEKLRGKVAPKMKRNDYPEAFEQAWSAYPPRPGGSKRAAFKAWDARLKQGAAAGQILAGVIAYAAYVKAMRTEPNFIQQAATFFGPSEYYACDWTAPEVQPKPVVVAWWISDALILAKGAEIGLRPYPGENMPNFKGRIQAALEGPPPAAAPEVRPIASAPRPPSNSDERAARPEGLAPLRDLVRKVAMPLTKP